MKMLLEKPPIYERALKEFPIKGKAVVFAWGDILYNPYDGYVPPELWAHEMTHGVQQKKMGGPDVWWDFYFDDPGFRLQQEIEAYANQYRFFCDVQLDKNERFRYLRSLGEELAGPMYAIGGSAFEYMGMIKSCPEVKIDEIV